MAIISKKPYIVLFVVIICLVNSITSYGVNDVSKNESGQYETINVTVEYVDNSPKHLLGRFKRNVVTTQMIFKCSRESCEDEVCKPEFYEGPNPPPWCSTDKNYKKDAKCSWSKSCWNHHSECTIQSTRCQHNYKDLANGGSRPLDTFNFECFYNENFCYVEQCKGVDNCGTRTMISIRQFEDEFLNRLPNCSDVDRKGRRRRNMGLYENGNSANVEEFAIRKERTPATVKALTGYCCEIGERWQGVKVAHVRPIIK